MSNSLRGLRDRVSGWIDHQLPFVKFVKKSSRITAFATSAFCVLLGTAISVFESGIFVLDLQEQARELEQRTTDSHKEGWVLTGINGSLQRRYGEPNPFGPLVGLFQTEEQLIENSRGDGVIIILTDIQPEDPNAPSSPYELAAVTNEDSFFEITPDGINSRPKLNTMTLQSAMMNAKDNNEPICLYVKGERSNKDSSYLNVFMVRRVNQEAMRAYNALLQKVGVLTNQNKELGELTRKYCVTDGQNEKVIIPVNLAN